MELQFNFNSNLIMIATHSIPMSPVVVNVVPADPARVNDPLQENAQGRNLLTRMAQSKVGLVLRLSTTKSAGGALIGIGVLLIPTGAGIALIAAGAVLWALSTVLTTANLIDCGTNKMGIFVSVGWSIALGTTGLLAPLSSGMLVLLWASMFMPLAADLIHYFFTPSDELLATQNRLAAEERTREVIVEKLRSIFVEGCHSITVAHNVITKGQAVRLELGSLTQNEDNYHDYISFESIHDSDQAWIAVPRDLKKTIYDLHEKSSFYNPAGGLELTQNPVTKVPLSDGMIIRGENLLTLISSGLPGD